MTTTPYAVDSRQIASPDGRELEVMLAGDPDGVPVVIHHGTPGSAGFYRPWIDDALAKGLRLISHSRPGYGLSTHQPGRTVADVAPDVATIADALGLDRFLTWGMSGGGPHALACAALLPDRVVAAATLAGVAPHDGEGLDYLDGMGPGNVEEHGRYMEGGREAGRESAEEFRAMFETATLDEVIEEMRPYLSDVDAAELAAGAGVYLRETAMHGLANGVEGFLDEDWVRPWGFDVGDIAVPVLLWQGRQDAMVPYGHGAWLAAHIPGVEAHLTEEDGHLTTVTRRLPSVHAWLLAHWPA